MEVAEAKNASALNARGVAKKNGIDGVIRESPRE